MTKTIGATYDGKTLCPDEPLDLKPNTHVQITLVMPASGSEKRNGKDRFEELFGSVSLGKPTGLDNETIDADLAREYGDPHEDVDRYC